MEAFVHHVRPFVTTRPCSYLEHSKRIALMLSEGLHDGQRWKPEAHDRYAELEAKGMPANKDLTRLRPRSLPDVIQRHIRECLPKREADRVCVLVREAAADWKEAYDECTTPMSDEERAEFGID